MFILSRHRKKKELSNFQWQTPRAELIFSQFISFWFFYSHSPRKSPTGFYCLKTWS
jgi:hypothetical protein